MKDIRPNIGYWKPKLGEDNIHASWYRLPKSDFGEDSVYAECSSGAGM